MKDDIFYRPLVILGQNCVDLMSVNLPSPLLVPNCPRINICSVCFLTSSSSFLFFHQKNHLIVAALWGDGVPLQAGDRREGGVVGFESGGAPAAGRGRLGGGAAEAGHRVVVAHLVHGRRDPLPQLG